MKFFRFIGSLAFVVGLFTAIFIGGPWHVYHNPMFPWWLKIAVYCIMGGILLVLLTVALEQKKGKDQEEELPTGEIKTRILLQNSADAIINIRFVTTSVIGSAAELLAYGTAVKLKKAKT
ncbi:hypothetical protein CVT91_17775 [Candidatus Atribacteria bacterium HGW-Atribacteria-1]|nr:MAG: hypothetical protein CVT91_17775 [Candidatus Atribacteria bacterium HGW-Atribacteria-1]